MKSVKDLSTIGLRPIENVYIISDSLLIFSLFQSITLCYHQSFRMSGNSALKINEAQAELEKAKEEVKEIQKQNNELKNEIVFKNLIENGEKVMDI